MTKKYLARLNRDLRSRAAAATEMMEATAEGDLPENPIACWILADLENTAAHLREAIEKRNQAPAGK